MKKVIFLFVLTISVINAKWVDTQPTMGEYASLLRAIEGFGFNKYKDYTDDKLFYKYKNNLKTNKVKYAQGVYQLTEAHIRKLIKLYNLNMTVTWTDANKYSNRNTWVKASNQALLFMYGFQDAVKDVKSIGKVPTVMNLWLHHNLGPDSFRMYTGLKTKYGLLTRSNFRLYMKRNMPYINQLSNGPRGVVYKFSSKEDYYNGWSTVIENWHNRKHNIKQVFNDDINTMFPNKEASFETFKEWLISIQGYNSDDYLDKRLFYSAGKSSVCKGMFQFSKNNILETLAHFKHLDKVKTIKVNWDDNDKLTSRNNWFTKENQLYILKLRYRWNVVLLKKKGIKPSNLNMWTAWHLGLEPLKFIKTGDNDFGVKYTTITAMQHMDQKMPFETMFLTSGEYEETRRYEVEGIESYQLAWANVMSGWHKLRNKTVTKKVVLKLKLTVGKTKFHMERLKGVNPALVSVIKQMKKDGVQFVVVTGNRTPIEQVKKVLHGFSYALHWGRHLSGNAVDIVPVYNGRAHHERKTKLERRLWTNLINNFFKAKKKAGIKIRIISFGKSKKWDYGHFQINNKQKMSKARFIQLVKLAGGTSLYNKMCCKLNRHRVKKGLTKISKI